MTLDPRETASRLRRALANGFELRARSQALSHLRTVDAPLSQVSLRGIRLDSESTLYLVEFVCARLDEFREEDHPRAEDGKFSSGGESSSRSHEESRRSSSEFSRSNKTTEDLYKRGGQWTSQRTEIHQAYVEKAKRGIPKSKTPTVYMTGGGPASGKTVALLSNPRTSIPDKTRAVHVDPDSAKESIPEFVEHRSDKSSAARVHEESSHMSKIAVRSSIADGHDVVYDSTGDSGIENLAAKVRTMREQGAQRVVAHYATVDVEEAVRRSDQRAARTGRFVPHAYLRQTHRDVSRTAKAAIEQGIFDSLDLWDNSGKEPTDVVSYTREKGLVVHDRGAWEAFQRRGEL